MYIIIVSQYWQYRIEFWVPWIFRLVRLIKTDWEGIVMNLCFCDSDFIIFKDWEMMVAIPNGWQIV